MLYFSINIKLLWSFILPSLQSLPQACLLKGGDSADTKKTHSMRLYGYSLNSLRVLRGLCGKKFYGRDLSMPGRQLGERLVLLETCCEVVSGTSPTPLQKYPIGV